MKEPFKLNGTLYQKIYQPVVAICLDGTSPAYLESAIRSGCMPVMKKLKEEKYFMTATSVMPSFTNPNNIAIITGTEPEKNGICGNYFYDVEQDCEVMMDKPEFLRVPTILEAASRAGHLVAAITAKNKLLKLLSKGWEGVAFSGERADQTQFADIGNVAEELNEAPPHYSEACINRYTMQAAYLVFCRTSLDLMYISLTDCVQHRSAPGQDEANIMLSEIDEIIGKFIDRGARVGITADHGMNYKIKADGTPNIIYLEDVITRFVGSQIRVVLPITDPYVTHHAALGSFATVYCLEKESELIKVMLSRTKGIDEVLTKNEACRKYALPADRMGDLVVLAQRDTVFGKTPANHDLSKLKGPLRSHGGLTETTVPFVLSETVDEDKQKKSVKNWELFDYLINRCNGL
ncbi:MAG: phosphonoacetate hydrolase [Desulfobacula sp.]|uniref:alkaline phosphatase family protein n=1 Tax=Desulfobacula sp. TaxID=2593537 RepID=UPI001D4BF28F|nr:phosphonoacetate hydrolase [Desulfobacula sp.]MBT6338385.1 phosphonoacetate hydrolase [Desulfobacula sp.]MBT6751383.1 phosphonoacetate hydrolase [Desulfobacula sp.]